MACRDFDLLMKQRIKRYIYTQRDNEYAIYISEVMQSFVPVDKM